MVVFPIAATVLAAVFTVQTWRAATRSSSPALATWSVALAQFAVASAALTWGVAFEWTSPLYRVFYLFGAILNVAWLGLGTVLLLAPDTVGRWLIVMAVVGASIYASVVVGTADLVPGAPVVLASEAIPAPSEVIPPGVRTLSRWFSIGGAAVVFGGLVLSMTRRRRHVAGLGLLAAGVAVVGAAGALARTGRAGAFAAALAAGIALMFVGFLRTGS